MVPASPRWVLWWSAGTLITGVTVWTLFGNRDTPEERERKRRLAVNGKGRVGNANIIDAREDVLYYEYSIEGASYTASQDISDLRGLVPEDLTTLIGPVTFKYLQRNPANSILICEDWSGLRIRHRRAAS